MTRQPGRLLRLIAVGKLLKATVLVAVAIGAFELVGPDTAAHIARWSEALAMHGHYLEGLVARIGGLDTHELTEIGVGALIYATVFLVEGIGLWLRQLWAEYVTIVVSTSFIPFEIYETTRSLTPTRVGTIAVNIAVVCYLALRLKKDRHWPFH